MISDSLSISNTEKQLITGLADKIVQRGLAVPAIFFLEMVKYMSFFGGQIMVFFGPIITVFLRAESYYKFAELMEDRKNVDFLLTEIERLEDISESNRK